MCKNVAIQLLLDANTYDTPKFFKLILSQTKPSLGKALILYSHRLLLALPGDFGQSGHPLSFRNY